MGTQSQSRLWFGRVLTWSTVPGGPNLRQTRYAGREHVIERLGRLAADQHGVYAGWHLWRSADQDEPGGQLGGYLAEDLALAKQLAETRIITDCPTYSLLGRPPSLLDVMRGSPTSNLTVAGATVPVVIVRDPTDPVIRLHRYDLVADPHMGTGERLGEIHVRIQRPADVATEPVTLAWSVVHVHNSATGHVHPTWEDAYTNLLAGLADDLTPARGTRPTRR